MNYHISNDAFVDGTFDQVQIIDGCLKASSGTWTSKIYKTHAFKKLLISWNSKSKGFIEVKVRVLNHKWSQWMTYGKWSDQGRNLGSVSQQRDEVALTSIDEIIAVDLCDAFQIRIEFSEDESVVRQLNVSLKDASSDIDLSILEKNRIINMDIEVPKTSQMKIPDIGNVICSPASLSMVLNYYGFKDDVIDVSQGCFDNGASIYGNWSYNIAYAGERGFDAQVVYCNDLKVLMSYIQKGLPLVASIKTKEKDELRGAPQAYPAGHLIVIRGFEMADQAYVLVNDPAAKTEEGVFRKYLLSDFLKVWNQVIYVIKPLKEFNYD